MEKKMVILSIRSYSAIDEFENPLTRPETWRPGRKRCFQ